MTKWILTVRQPFFSLHTYIDCVSVRRNYRTYVGSHLMNHHVIAPIRYHGLWNRSHIISTLYCLQRRQLLSLNQIMLTQDGSRIAWIHFVYVSPHLLWKYLFNFHFLGRSQRLWTNLKYLYHTINFENIHEQNLACIFYDYVLLTSLFWLHASSHHWCRCRPNTSFLNSR